MKKVLPILLLLLTAGLRPGYSQGPYRIQFINGKEAIADQYLVQGLDFVYTRSGEKPGKNKVVDRYDVFSVTGADSVEKIIYEPFDSLDYSVEEARQYILGEKAAFRYYKRPANIISSVAIGAGAVALGVQTFPALALPIPMIYSVILGQFNPRKMQIPEGTDLPYSQTEAYRFGYEKAARNLKIQQTLKWGFISVGVGVGAYFIAKEIQ